MNRIIFYCITCGANWTKGNYTPECNECGGGALKRSCIVCDGTCGNTWKKMPLDQMIRVRVTGWDFAAFLRMNNSRLFKGKWKNKRAIHDFAVGSIGIYGNKGE